METRKNAVLVLFLMIIFCVKTHDGNNKKNITHQEHKEIKKNEKKKDSMTRWARAKRIITVPVDYFFGKENSSAKTAFCVSVGLVITVTTLYSIYHLSFIQPKFNKKQQDISKYLFKINELQHELHKTQHELHKTQHELNKNQHGINKDLVKFVELQDELNKVQQEVNKELIKSIKELTYAVMGVGIASGALAFGIFFYR